MQDQNLGILRAPCTKFLEEGNEPYFLGIHGYIMGLVEAIDSRSHPGTLIVAVPQYLCLCYHGFIH